MRFFNATFAVSLAGCALGALQNVSIDDQNGDPITGQQILYNPQSSWSFGPNCTACFAKVTPAENPFDGTWHDASHEVGGPIVSASANFVGTAVYVMCILTRSGVIPDGNTDMIFMLDNEVVGNFSLPPNGDPSYIFDVPVYFNTNLEPGLHNITLISGLAGSKSLVLLDRIIYTTGNINSAQITNSTTSASSGTANSVPTTPTSTTLASSHARHTGKKIWMGSILVITVLLCFV